VALGSEYQRLRDLARVSAEGEGADGEGADGG